MAHCAVSVYFTNANLLISHRVSYRLYPVWLSHVQRTVRWTLDNRAVPWNLWAWRRQHQLRAPLMEVDFLNIIHFQLTFKSYRNIQTRNSLHISSLKPISEILTPLLLFETKKRYSCADLYGYEIFKFWETLKWNHAIGAYTDLHESHICDREAQFKYVGEC